MIEKNLSVIFTEEISVLNVKSYIFLKTPSILSSIINSNFILFSKIMSSVSISWTKLGFTLYIFRAFLNNEIKILFVFKASEPPFNITAFPDLKDKHKIKAVPTIIVFDEDEEVVRFEANIMMELEATKKDIQKEIDKIYLAKFEWG